MTCPIPPKAATRGEIPQKPCRWCLPCRDALGESAPYYLALANTCPPAVGPYRSLAAGLPDDAEASCQPHIDFLAIGPRRTQICESKETETQRAKQ